MGISQTSHVTKSDLLSHHISGVLDSMYYNQAAPVTKQSLTYEHSIYEDVIFDEVPASQVAYGTEVLFRFGQSGSPLLQGIELVAKWPAPHGNHDATEAEALSRDDDEWCPYLGYMILGKTDGRPCTIRYVCFIVVLMRPILKCMLSSIEQVTCYSNAKNKTRTCWRAPMETGL